MKPDEERLSDEEFMRRLRARFIERGVNDADAIVENATVAEWRSMFDNEPEDSADEEMSCWTDDGAE